MPFTVRASDVEELTDGPPAELALANAELKARSVAAGLNAGGERPPVLAVDTVVALDGQVHGKPSDRAEATATLTRLAGREHAVVSGVCVIRDGVASSVVAETAVRFRALTSAEIEAYVETGEWRERAGGYAIQGRGAVLVSEIRGDYLNVVGLPVSALVAIAPELLAV